MTILKFKTADVRPLFTHAKQASKHAEDYNGVAKPALILAKDHGVYLMSSGEPADIIDKEKGSRRVAYADTMNPDQNEDEWYDNARHAMGGDDGADFLPLAMFEDAIEDDEEWIKVRVSSSSIRVQSRTRYNLKLLSDQIKERLDQGQIILAKGRSQKLKTSPPNQPKGMVSYYKNNGYSHVISKWTHDADSAARYIIENIYKGVVI